MSSQFPERRPVITRPLTVDFSEVRREHARFIVIEGANRGAKHIVRDGLVVGRGRNADVVVDAPDISREHLRFHLGLLPEVEDLGSRNGTFVNDFPVKGRVALAFGDRIRIGARTILLYTRHDPAEAEMLKRQRLELLGRMAAGIVHDVNNLLGALLATQDYLLGSPTDVTLGDEETRECMLEIKAAGEQAAHLMPKLLSFARGNTDGHRRIDVSSMCDEVAQIVRRTFDRRIAVETDIAPDLFIVGDRVELQQVLMNLCVNARDAMTGAGVLRIRVHSEGETVRICISDTGEGIDAHTKARIFEPFFTTKTNGRGSGLGLATAKEMVELHGGSISVSSAVGMGTAFTIVVPASTRAQSEGRTSPPEVEESPFAADVLLVDDDPLCRKAFARLLRRAGHRVTVAASGKEAVLQLKHKPAPDLVMLDVDMPGLSGEETLRQMRMHVPTLTVLAVTGSRDSERHAAMVGGGAVSVLTKPFTAETLSSTVSITLASAFIDLIDDEETATIHC